MSQSTIYVKKHMEGQQRYKHNKTGGNKMIVIIMLLYIRTELRLCSTLGIF